MLIIIIKMQQFIRWTAQILNYSLPYNTSKGSEGNNTLRWTFIHSNERFVILSPLIYYIWRVAVCLHIHKYLSLKIKLFFALAHIQAIIKKNYGRIVGVHVVLAKIICKYMWAWYIAITSTVEWIFIDRWVHYGQSYRFQ